MVTSTAARTTSGRAHSDQVGVAGAEPEGEAVLRSEIPPPCPPNVQKGFWDAVVRRLALLNDQEALKIAFPGDQITNSMKSSLFTAAGRAGLRVKIIVRAACVYTWITGVRNPKRRRPPRKPFPCEVCGKPVIPPKTGASVHYVCRPTGSQRSWCYRVRALARKRGITIKEADQYLRGWHAKQKGGRSAA
jgi:hypothetical protein